MRRRAATTWAFALAALAALAQLAHAQDPKQPLAGQTIAIVEPSGQGSVTHIVAGLLTAGMEKALGARVVIETVPSPETSQAFDRVFTAKPDGRTLLVVTDAARLFYEVLAAARAKMEAMTPIAKLTDGVSLTLAATADSPIKDYAALVAALKAKRALKLALNGNASPSGVFAAIIEDHAGGRFADRTFDIDFMIDDGLRAGLAEIGILPTPALFRPSGKPNELRALLTSGARRHPRLADVPTLVEVTGNAKLSFTAAVGLLGPPGMPGELTDALTKAVVASAQAQDARQGAERSSIPLNVHNALVLRESMARAKRVINDLLN